MSDDRPSNPFLRAIDAIPPIWRDVLVALLVIGVLMGGLWLYTGQPVSQAPLVVVESGSMMHPESPYGRVGTIDPGDLILVKDVDGGRNGVVTLHGAQAPPGVDFPGVGGRDGYGLGGDVVIYRQSECPGGGATPIIHRAVTWVEVRGTGAGRAYTYLDAEGNLLRDRPDVHLPEMMLSHAQFPTSGWITKGDNPETNRPADQSGICSGQLIQPDWLIGKARGEIPWIGLLKFIVQGNSVNRPEADWCTVGNAYAPCDTFTMLWVTLGVVVAIPLAWDLTMRIKRKRGGGKMDGEAFVEPRPDEPARPLARPPERPAPPDEPPRGPPRP